MDSKLVKILDKNIDQQQLIKDIVAEMILPALDEMVAKSETKIDDVILEGAKKLLQGL